MVEPYWHAYSIERTERAGRRSPVRGSPGRRLTELLDPVGAAFEIPATLEVQDQGVGQGPSSPCHTCRPNFTYEMGMGIGEDDTVAIHGRNTGFGPTPMIAVDNYRVEDGKIRLTLGFLGRRGFPKPHPELDDWSAR